MSVSRAFRLAMTILACSLLLSIDRGVIQRCVVALLVGFLYMSDFLHQFLAATQYIAPLMANFDTRIGHNESRVLYYDTGEYRGGCVDIFHWECVW